MKIYDEKLKLSPKQAAFAAAVEHLRYREFEDGWIKILEDLHARISSVYPDYKIIQIKEKFGGLRYYISPIPANLHDTIQGYIREAEDQAEKTCETCGAPGSLSKSERGWLKTVCDQHMEGRERFSWSSADEPQDHSV